MLPLTLSEALLDTVPNLLLAVQVNTPESSGKTSAITKVQISSEGKTEDTHIIKSVWFLQLESILTQWGQTLVL